MKKKTTKSGKLTVALSVCLLASFVCGISDSAFGAGSVFRAVLSPENAHLSAAVGTAEISIQGDLFTSTITVNNALSTGHLQHIHAGSRCPTPADDKNGDGVVDAVEAAAVYGRVVVPLDSDLTSNLGSFPIGANYNYEQSASFAQVLANLNLPILNVEGLVVNIHGIPDSVKLPPTAQGSKAAFPISCGILQRVWGPW